MGVYDGMTSEQRVAKRRQRILNAGLELFAQQGFSRVSIRGILRQAELQDRYFAENFSSLDDLMGGLLRRIYDAEVALCTEAIAGESTRREKVVAMLETLTRLLTDDPRQGRVKFLESVGAGPISSRERQHGLMRVSRIVAGLLENEPLRTGTNTTVLAVAVVGGVNEILINWVSGLLPISRQEVVEQGVGLFEAVAEFNRL